MVWTSEDPNLMADLSRILEQEHYAEMVMARIRQEKAKRELGSGRNSVDGLGRVCLEIDPYVYHYWSAKLGPECWQDKQFRHEFMRDNPEARVECKGTKTQVGWTGGGKRYKKTYEDNVRPQST